MEIMRRDEILQKEKEKEKEKRKKKKLCLQE